LIGDCAFQVRADDERQAQIGFTLSPTSQKQGYATEAVTGLLNVLFGKMRLHRVTATCDVENEASVRLLERIGMRREARFLESVWFKGAWGSEYVYAVLDKEWSRARCAADRCAEAGMGVGRTPGVGAHLQSRSSRGARGLRGTRDARL